MLCPKCMELWSRALYGANHKVTLVLACSFSYKPQYSYFCVRLRWSNSLFCYFMPVVRYRQQHTVNCRRSAPVIRSMSLWIGPYVHVHVSVLGSMLSPPEPFFHPSNLWIAGQIFMKHGMKNIPLETTLHCIVHLPTIFSACSEDMHILLILFLCSVK
jgi:hypothetical protein